MKQDPDALIAKARMTNARRDTLDRSAGFAAPGDAGEHNHLRTAKDAIYAGLASADWDCVAEGYVMLEQIEKRKFTQ